MRLGQRTLQPITGEAPSQQRTFRVEFLWSLRVDCWSFLRAKHGYLRFYAIGVASVARVENAGRHTEIPRRLALQPQLHRALAKESPARSHRVMSRGRDFRGGRTSHSRIPAINLRFGSRTGHRSRSGDF